MRYLVRRSNALYRPLLAVVVHLLGKLVKANLGYRREHPEFFVHQTGRRIVLGARRKIVEFSSRGQEDRDEGAAQDSAQGATELREYSPPRVRHRFN